MVELAAPLYVVVEEGFRGKTFPTALAVPQFPTVGLHWILTEDEDLLPAPAPGKVSHILSDLRVFVIQLGVVEVRTPHLNQKVCQFL